MVGRTELADFATQLGEGKETRRKLARPYSLVLAVVVERKDLGPALSQCSGKAEHSPRELGL